MEMDLWTEAGVVVVCRVGVESPFFSGCECVLTCKVNSRAALIGGSLTFPAIQKYLLSLTTWALSVSSAIQTLQETNLAVLAAA